MALKKPIKYMRQSLIYIFVCLLILFQYYNDSIFCSLFVVVFFVAFAIFRRVYFTLVMVLILAIVLFYTPVLGTWVHLRSSNLNVIQNPKQTLPRIFQPNSGQEVLPPQVQQMLSLLETNRVTSYQLSERIYSDPLINQRITEAAWPIRKEPKSYYLFKYFNEAIKHPSCIMIDQRKEMELDYCH